MAKPTSKKKRNKLIVALLAPILLILFIVGWNLYYVGQKRQPNIKQPQKPIKKAPTEQNNIELIMVPQQEKEILGN
jgi:flagellar basal body-associated protein FliL